MIYVIKVYDTVRDIKDIVFFNSIEEVEEYINIYKDYGVFFAVTSFDTKE